MLLNDFENVLVLSPHTDDAEFGCGATISKLLRAGKNVDILCFSYVGEETLKQEWLESLKSFPGQDEQWQGVAHLNNIDVRYFPNHRQEILDIMISHKGNYDLVLCPSSFDTHQDHEVVRNEAFRAFKNTTILGYEMPWNTQNFRTDAFIEVSKDDVKTKWDAIKEYKSQSERPYATREYVEGLAIVRGVQSHVPLAEVFEVIRLVIK